MNPILEEAFKQLEAFRDNVITIDVDVPYTLVESDLPSGNVEDLYDELTLERWYDFASTIEGIIENMGKIVNISLSKHEDSLSEYIDFYSYDTEGNLRDGLIDLRLSDHKQTSNSKGVRRKHVSRLDPHYNLETVIVNDKVFSSYRAAIKYVRELLANYLVDNN